MSERREELGQKIKDYNSAGAKMRRLEQQLADVGSINLRLMEQLAERQWISVEDRLPESKGEYLVYCKADYEDIVECLYWDGKNWMYEGGPTFCLSYLMCPAHWMPMPEPPQEQGK